MAEYTRNVELHWHISCCNSRTPEHLTSGYFVFNVMIFWLTVNILLTIKHNDMHQNYIEWGRRVQGHINHMWGAGWPSRECLRIDDLVALGSFCHIWVARLQASDLYAFVVSPVPPTCRSEYRIQKSDGRSEDWMWFLTIFAIIRFYCLSRHYY